MRSSPEQQKICPETGAQLVKIGEEVTQKIAHKPGSYYIKEIIRYKYALPQGAGVLTPPLPEALLERCQADESFLANLLTNLLLSSGNVFVDESPVKMLQPGKGKNHRGR